jgi:hypothetical protein
LISLGVETYIFKGIGKEKGRRLRFPKLSIYISM